MLVSQTRGRSKEGDGEGDKGGGGRQRNRDIARQTADGQIERDGGRERQIDTQGRRDRY